MLKKILLGLGVLVVALCAVVATRADTYHVERSQTIAAPADVVFPLANNLHQWVKWSPWSELDPQMKATFSGPPEGVGASYSWASTKDEVGEGKMTISASKPNERVDYQLEFIKPFASTPTIALAFAPEGDKVKATWSMDGKNNFVGKAFSMVMSMDDMIGKDFEKGLRKLDLFAKAEVARRAAEEAAKKAAEAAALAAAPAAASPTEAAKPAKAQ